MRRLPLLFRRYALLLLACSSSDATIAEREGVVGVSPSSQILCPSSKFAVIPKLDLATAKDIASVRGRGRGRGLDSLRVRARWNFQSRGSGSERSPSPETKDQRQDRRSCMTWLLLQKLLLLEIVP
ncbi:hypothetical protein BT93_C0308 [Corymbia citriodora subsp. variegata]|nr:hypothetical protein BT93_C0308 [Corymbia citriodora subsp. variegata]